MLSSGPRSDVLRSSGCCLSRPRWPSSAGANLAPRLTTRPSQGCAAIFTPSSCYSLCFRSWRRQWRGGTVSSNEWQAVVSGNAELRLTQVAAGRLPALRLDFDFKQGGGFVVARRALKRDVPEEYAVRFRVRGRGPVNNLELKLVDTTGQNVWRHVLRDLRLPARWKQMEVSSRDIDFAWGPSSGGRLRELGSMEFAIVAGEGGKGTLWIAGIEIENRGPTEAPELSASSAQPEYAAAGALGSSGWKPQSEDPRPWIAIDSKQPRTIGGLIIDWLDRAPAKGFRIRVSSRGIRWKTLYAARA